MQGHFAEGHFGNSLIRAPHGVLNLALASVFARHAILNQSQYDPYIRTAATAPGPNTRIPEVMHVISPHAKG